MNEYDNVDLDCGCCPCCGCDCEPELDDLAEFVDEGSITAFAEELRGGVFGR